jgi:hypothetical protein
MSHISKIELEVTDLGVLSQACKRLGLTLIRGKRTFKWYGKNGACHHAIHIPQAAYEVGIIKKEGRYELSCDFFDQELVKVIGKSGGLLKQAYAVEKAKIEARKKGYSVIEKMTDTGIRLHVRLQ